MHNSKEEAFGVFRALVDRFVPSAYHHGSILLGRIGGASVSIRVIDRRTAGVLQGFVALTMRSGAVVAIGTGTGSTAAA